MKRYFFGILTALLLLACPRAARATSYYISPTGNDSNNGLSSTAPLGTFNKAWQLLKPGDSLLLMDGVYYQSISPNVRDGAANSAINTQDYVTYPLDNPERTKNYITIKALNDGKAIIDGQGQRFPVRLGHWEQGGIGEYYIIEGIEARNSAGAVYELMDHNIIIRRSSGYNANTDGNFHVFTIISKGSPSDPANILLEDDVAGGSGRKMFLAYGTYVNVIFRRLFAAGTEWRGANFCPNNWPWQDGIEIYNWQQPDVDNNSIVENSIVYGKLSSYGFSLSPNPARTIGNKFLGDMAINVGMNYDNTPTTWACDGNSPYNPTCRCTDFSNWQSTRAGFVFGTYSRPFYKNNTFKDLFAWGNASVGLSAGEPVQSGGWCDGTEGDGRYPCAKCNATETSPSDNCVAGQITPSEKSSNNVLSNISLANNGLGKPTPLEGAGTETTTFSLSMFDKFGSKSNLYIEGNSQYADKSKGARLRYRYVNGVLMDGSNGKPAQELWPWPMEDRIKTEFARELGIQNYSVTSTMVPLINQNTSQQVSLTTTQTPVVKVGDTNNDGKVDIFDYNNLQTDFATSTARSDFDKNGRVDIFDYNLLISNFGK